MKNKLRLLTFFILSVFTTIIYAQPPSDGYYLDGIDDFIELQDSDNINTTTVNNKTVEGYFKVDNGTNRQMIYKEGGGSRGIIIYVENNYVVVGAYNRSNSDYTPRWNGTYFREPISDDTWYHVALVLDNVAVPVNNPIAASDNTSFKWYLDGTLMDSRAGFEIRSHSGDVNIGRSDSNVRYPNCGSWTSGGSSEYCFNNNSQSNASNYFAGNVWGFRVWDDVRTATEIDDNKDILITTVGTDNLVAALDGNTVSYLDDSNSVITDSGSNPDVITWSATAASTDWATGTNWVGGVVPDSDKLESVTIPSSTNYPEIKTHIKVGNLTIDATASISIDTGATLDIHYDVTNNGTITVENDGALITREESPIGGTGSFTVKRDSPNYTNRYFYSYWSSPVEEADATIATIFPNVGGYDYYWDASIATPAWNNNHTDMEVGRGYALRANHFNVETANFSGTVNNGRIEEPIYFSTDPDSGESGFNIIGNPYPSAIEWEKLHADNSDIMEGTVYYWRQTDAPTGDNLATDYIEYNSTGSNPLGAADGNIATGQGFAVQSKSGGGTVVFQNTQRVVANNDQFFRAASAANTSNNQTDGRISLRLSGDGKYSTQLIGFIPEGTENYDDRYDGIFINEGADIEFYSQMPNYKLSIQALPELTDVDVQVPLGYQVTAPALYTLSIDAEFLSPDFDIVLEDTYLNVLTDLRQTNYSFNVTAPVEENDRFFLRLDHRSTLSIEDIQEDTNKINVYFSDDVLNINTTYNNLEGVKLYTVTGKLVVNTKYKNQITTNGLANGIYILQVEDESGALISKKVIKS